MSYDSPPVVAGFRELFRASAHRQSLCVLAVLKWIACCDGKIAPSEGELLRRMADAGEQADELTAVLDLSGSIGEDDLDVACRFLRSETSRGGKQLLAELAIAMAVQDGKLTVGENLVLQFLADLLGITPRAFNKLFEQIAHRPFPPAGDPSSPEWWERHDAGLDAQVCTVGPTATVNSESPTVLAAPPPMTADEAWAVMGLEPGASPQTVHATYRRLAKKRHPDRFGPLGAAAVASATLMFERLQQAYRILCDQPPLPYRRPDA